MCLNLTTSLRLHTKSTCQLYSYILHERKHLLKLNLRVTTLLFHIPHVKFIIIDYHSLEDNLGFVCSGKTWLLGRNQNLYEQFLLEMVHSKHNVGPECVLCC